MPNIAVHESPETLKPSKSPTKVSFVSLGCPKNLVDTEVMMGMLEEAGAHVEWEAPQERRDIQGIAETVALSLVASGTWDTIKAAVASPAGVPLDLFQRLVISPCSVTALVRGTGGHYVLCVNATSSLAELALS